MRNPVLRNAIREQLTQSAHLVYAKEMERLTRIKMCVLSVVKAFLDYPAEFYGDGRFAQVVTLRMAVAARLRNHYCVPFAQIALVMERPNHSTIITAVQRWNALPDSHTFDAKPMGSWRGVSKIEVATQVAAAFERCGANEVLGGYRLVGLPAVCKKAGAKEPSESGYCGA